MYVGENVGIGTTSPSYALHVVGDGYVSGSLTIGGTLAVDNISITGTEHLVWISQSGSINSEKGNLDITSVTNDSTGLYTINFSSLPTNIYMFYNTLDDFGTNQLIIYATQETTTQIRVRITDYNGTLTNAPFNMMIKG